MTRRFVPVLLLAFFVSPAMADDANNLTISVSPHTAAVMKSSSQQFHAQVKGSSDIHVRWYVDGIAGGTAGSGTISDNGLYQAPSTPGTHTIQAVSSADPTQTASVTALVTAGVTVDFGSRTVTSRRIPVGILSSQYSQPMPSTAIALLPAASFAGVRLHSNIASVYATRTADWSQIDQSMDKLKAAGLRPILEMTMTPPWLAVTPTGCTASPKNPPEDVTTWAQLAASFVAHMDQKYPGFVQDYEIWNEPELGTFCVYPNTSANRFSRYLSIYSAAAPLMKAQAAKDGQTIRIGGPTIVSIGAISQWIGGLVNNTTVAPYVDFVSYHFYPSGQAEITSGMKWDVTSSTGTRSLYSRIQDPSIGEAAVFKAIASAVRQGKQPNPSQTPIYFDEFNDNWAFSNDCCRNSPIYSPLFNALVVADTLNAVYQGAHTVPSKLVYYSASNPPFCLLGQVNSSMNCSTAALQPYPQYYTYKLIGTKQYLGLSSGGYMAASVSPNITQSGLSATAFYTPTQDSVLIINPSSTSYSGVTVTMANPGVAATSANLFILNSSNQQIATQSVALSPGNGGYTASITIPAYTVVGISIPVSSTGNSPAPSITSVSPSSGPVAGGTVVTISGANFASGTKVNFGSTAASSVTFVSSTSLQATTPPVGAAGNVNVTVTNPDGQSATLSSKTLQLLSNAGFESGSTGWRSNGVGTAAIVSNSSAAHSGSYYAQLSTSGSGQPIYFAIDSTGNAYFPVAPGDVITFGGWAYRVSGNGYGRWKLQVLDANKSNAVFRDPSPSNTTTASWTNQQGSYTIPSGKAYIRFYSEIYQSTTASSVRFDDSFLTRKTSGGFTYTP